MEEEIKYVECSVCRKRLYLGEKVLTKRFYAGIYCSPNCYANSFDIGCCQTVLTEDFAFKKDVLVYGGDFNE